jgi:PhoPQ-activated pathogenicity-related protein
VDRRVVAVAPAVIDVLNFKSAWSTNIARTASGRPPWPTTCDMRIMDWFGTPQLRALLRIEEPYEYRHRLTMPKYIVNSAGDQFFFPESSRFYFDDLPGEKYLRYIPNTDHSLKNSDVYLSLAAFYDAIVHGRPPRPTSLGNSSVTVRSASRPPSARRKSSCGRPPIPRRAISGSNPSAPPGAVRRFEDRGGGVYVARVSKPAQGWTAFFMELSYPLGGPRAFQGHHARPRDSRAPAVPGAPAGTHVRLPRR